MKRARLKGTWVERIVDLWLRYADADRVAMESGQRVEKVHEALGSQDGQRILREREAKLLSDAGLSADEIKTELRILAKDPRQRGSARVKALELLGKTEGLWGGEKDTGAPTHLQKLSPEELDRAVIDGLTRLADRVAQRKEAAALPVVVEQVRPAAPQVVVVEVSTSKGGSENG